MTPGRKADSRNVGTRPVTVDAEVKINGDLAVPDQLIGAVVFAHGSGSSRHSSRNRIAAHLQGRWRIAGDWFSDHLRFPPNRRSPE